MENLSKIQNSSISKGEIWLAFDSRSNKIRPFIILTDKLIGIDIDMSLLTVTSHSKIRNPYDINIEYWEEAGLFKPSIARCSKINTIEKKFLRQKLGTLQDEDWIKIKEAVKNYFDL